MNLEQSCVRPGHWRIEGWDVRRVDRTWIAARFADEPAIVRPTLHAIREEIADRIEQSRGT